MTARPLALCSIRLPRDGTAPLRFNGWPIARHDGYVARGGVWHDLSLYRDAAGGYVVEIVARCADVQPVLPFPSHTVKPPHDHAASRAPRQAIHLTPCEVTKPAPLQATHPAPVQATHPAPLQATHPARYHAAMFTTLDEALSALENHDASADLAPVLGAPALALDDPALSLAARVLHAASLQAFCQDVERRYRIGVGAMLAAIGLRMI